jgi:hypothetical protein
MYKRTSLRGKNSRDKGRGKYHKENKNRKKQMKENLCFKCNKPGHCARDYPKRSSQQLYIMIKENGITDSKEQKADTLEKTYLVAEN